MLKIVPSCSCVVRLVIFSSDFIQVLSSGFLQVFPLAVYKSFHLALYKFGICFSTSFLIKHFLKMFFIWLSTILPSGEFYHLALSFGFIKVSLSSFIQGLSFGFTYAMSSDFIYLFSSVFCKFCHLALYNFGLSQSG